MSSESRHTKGEWEAARDQAVHAVEMRAARARLQAEEAGTQEEQDDLHLIAGVYESVIDELRDLKPEQSSSDSLKLRKLEAFEELREALNQATAFVDPSRYDEVAAWFYSATGLLAPGKDAPALAHEVTYEDRQAAWREWLLERRRDHRRILEAAALRSALLKSPKEE